MLKKLLIIALVALTGNGILGYFVYKSNEDRLVSEYWVQHTMRVRFQADNLFTLGSQAKIALRAYKVTKDTSFFEPLHVAQNNIMKTIIELTTLTRDNPLQQKRLQTLQLSMRKFLARSLLDVGINSDTDPSKSKMLFNHEKIFTGQINGLIGSVQKDEIELLKVRIAQNKQDITNSHWATLVVFLSMVGFTILLLITTSKIIKQGEEKDLRANELILANETLDYENDEKLKRANELDIANKELSYQTGEKGKRAAELVIAGKELVFQNREKEDRAAELLVANIELRYQNGEKEKRSKELVLANIELEYQNQEKENRAAELAVANIELSFQNEEKEKRANELIIANKELLFQNDEKGKRAAELVIANIELSFQNNEKEKRADELVIANKELVFQNREKGNRAAELMVANNELSYQNQEKEKRAIELKNTISLLNHSEMFNQGILNSLSSHIAVMDNFGKIIAVNESWNKFAILNGGTTLLSTGAGSNYFDICTTAVMNGELLAGIAMQGIRAVFSGSSPIFYLEYPCHSPSEERWFGMRAIKFEGSEDLVVVSHLNITERKLAEQQLLVSESNLKEAQLMAHMGSYEVNLVNESYVWSDELFNILGISKETVAPSSEKFMSFVHPDDLVRVKKGLAEDFKSRKISGREFRFITQNGEIRYGRTESQFELDDQEKPVRLFGIFQDVTKQKLAELEKTRMLNELLTRNKDLEQFSYIVSHNFRSPIANILGASIALKDTDLSECDRQTFEKGIEISVLKLDQVVRDLNQILEVRRGINERKTMVNFHELLEDIKDSISDVVEKHDVKISCDFNEITEMFSLRPYLHSIFYNLITNSIKYRRIDIPVSINIKSRMIANSVELKFTDNGMGIDLLKKGEEVFTMYKRFHLQVEGKGMGLFMVKTQIEALNGNITLESDVNQGCVFTLRFSDQKVIDSTLEII